MLFPKRIKEPESMNRGEMEAFEKLAKESNLRWTVVLIDNVQKLLPRKKTLTILDASCGPGLLSKALAEAFPNASIQGLDLSPHAIRLAKTNCKTYKNIHFQQGNVYKIPFKSYLFDAVICKDSLHHYNKPVKALEEMLRVLKSGGLLYIQDLRRDMPKYLLEESVPPNTPIKKLQYYSARASYTKKELRHMLSKLKVRRLKIGTKKITDRLMYLCKKCNLNPQSLKRSLQARMSAIAYK